MSNELCKDLQISVPGAQEHQLYARVRGVGWQVLLVPFGTQTNSYVRGEVDGYAYVVTPSDKPAGAVSVKIANRAIRDADKSNTIYLSRGEVRNRCGTRRALSNAEVRINEYIDYHETGAASWTLGSQFHFKYPAADGSCAKTDEAGQIVSSFLFDDVSRTEGDTWVGRNISHRLPSLARDFKLVTPAYAIKHQHSYLRAELHYHDFTGGKKVCAGFKVPADSRTNQSRITVTDLERRAFGPLEPKTWVVDWRN